METYKNMTTITIESTEWIAIATSDMAWKMLSVGGIPIMLTMLAPGDVPDASSRVQYILGGIINNVTCPIGLQAWVRMDAGVGTLAYYPAAYDYSDQLEEIKASIIGIDTHVIQLSQRTTALEMNQTANDHTIELVRSAQINLQGIIATLLADMTELRVKQLENKMELYAYVDHMLASLQARMNASISELRQDLAAATGLTEYLGSSSAEQLAAILTNLAAVHTELTDIQTQITGNDTDIAALVDLVNTIDNRVSVTKVNYLTSTADEVKLYWDGLVSLVRATSLDAINNAYAAIVAQPGISDDLVPVIGVIKTLVQTQLMNTSNISTIATELDTTTTNVAVYLNGLGLLKDATTPDELNTAYATLLADPDTPAIVVPALTAYRDVKYSLLVNDDSVDVAQNARLELLEMKVQDILNTCCDNSSGGDVP